MLKTLQKHTPIISVLLLVALLVALLFYPASSRVLSTIVIVFGIGTAVILTIKSNQEQKESDELSRDEFIRNTFLDLLGLALVMGAAMWLGRLAGGYAGRAVESRAGQIWGMVAGILAGMVVGFGVAFIVGRVWGIVSNRLRTIPV